MGKKGRSRNQGEYTVTNTNWPVPPEAMVYFRIIWKGKDNKHVPDAVAFHPLNVNPDLFREPKKKKKTSSVERPHSIRWVLVGYDLQEDEKIVISSMKGSEGLMELESYDIIEGQNCVRGFAKSGVKFIKPWHYDITIVVPNQKVVSARRPLELNRLSLDPIVIIKEDP